MRVCPRCRSIYSVPVERCGIDGTPIVEQHDDPLVGSDIDRYRVLAPLGRGAMGCVYRAKHNVLPTECAIKVLYGNFAINQRLIERFRREAQSIAKMSHPNIVSVIDFGATDLGLTFLVMELVEGRTLEKAIATDPLFDPQRAARVARQLASGLSEAHRRGFVHRDMKPANVMLAEKDGYDIVKILDFGVVGMMQAAAAAKLTAAGHIVGTPSYMAPEQARTSSVNQSADLYALGCILYEMLAGVPPFEGMGVAEVLMKHLHEKPRPLPDARGLERLAMWLLEKEPEKRPPSAIRVIAEIDRLNLGTANTEQIMVAKAKHVHGPAEFDRTVPVEIVPDPAERSERDTADWPIPTIEKLNQRPVLDRTDPPMSTSAMDTEKPYEREERDLVAPSTKLAEAERAVMALMQSETVRDTPKESARKKQVPTRPPQLNNPQVSAGTWVVLIVLLLGSVVLMGVMALR